MNTLGGFACQGPVASINTAREKGSNRYVVGRHRAVVYPEMGGESLDIDLLKRISGGELIDDRGLYAPVTLVKPRAAIYVVGNAIPKAFVEDEPLQSRIAPYRF